MVALHRTKRQNFQNSVVDKSSARKSFIIHKDSLDILDKLSDEQAGKLFKIIKSYQKTKQISDLDFTLDLVFTPFLNQFLRDDENYRNICEARKSYGAKGGKQKVVNASKSKQKVANVADSDSKNESDNDSDSNIKIEKKVIEFEDGLRINLDEEEMKSAEISRRLIDVLFTKRGKTASTLHLTDCAKAVKALRESLTDREDSESDILKAIDILETDHGEKFFPEIYFGRDFENKFFKIEGHIKRKNQTKQSKHTNFEKQDYRAGVNADGSF